MLARCLSCYAPFPANAIFERVPLGRRLAFDPGRGRLWIICGVCARWTLQPIEARWEALADLERAVVDDARLLVGSENMALYEIGDLELVRVGRASGREEAWWRYGRELTSRRDRALGTMRRGRLIERAAAFVLIGLPVAGFVDPQIWVNRSRRRRFGTHAWRGEAECARCGAPQRALRLAAPPPLFLHLADDGQLALHQACPRCGADQPDAGVELAGTTAQHVLQRILAWHNFTGAPKEVIDRAMVRVGDAGSVTDMLHDAPHRRLPLLTGTESTLTLEILLNTEVERKLLAMQLSELTARWREEEELAAIIDGELTPLRRRS